MMPTTMLPTIKNVKFSLASCCFFSPAFFMITALPPVASMVEIAVTKEIIGADKLIADKAFVPIRLETNKPSTIV